MQLFCICLTQEYWQHRLVCLCLMPGGRKSRRRRANDWKKHSRISKYYFFLRNVVIDACFNRQLRLQAVRSRIVLNIRSEKTRVLSVAPAISLQWTNIHKYFQWRAYTHWDLHRHHLQRQVKHLNFTRLLESRRRSEVEIRDHCHRY